MSNDKPCAVAVIKFYANKHVEVELSTIKNITPRTLDIASHIMLKTYRGMKAKFIADEHKQRRKDVAEAEAKTVKDEAAWHEAEDERLRLAALEDVQEIKEEIPIPPEKSEEVEKPKEDEVPEELEITKDKAEDDAEESEDKQEVV